MTSVVIPVGHVNVQLIAEGDAIVRMTQNGKAWEPETRSVLGEWLVQSPLCTVLDVGAYTGVYAIAAALMGHKVVALEPHPSNYARLLMNCALNSMRIEALPVAASNETGTRRLHVKLRINDTASLEHKAADPLCTDYIEVPIKRIDDLVFKSRVGLIKIDVEHHEVNVLLGAQRTIATHKPMILVETLDIKAFDAVCLCLQTSTVGYTLKGVLDGRNKLFATNDVFDDPHAH
jgi:FkbM family methyltransferase